VDLNALKVLTNDTIKAIRNFDIVTPELFKETFLTKAQEHKIPIDLEALADQTLDLTLHKVYEIEAQTKANTQLLQKNIDMATTAIDMQDKNLLDQVQAQMRELNRRISLLEEQVYLDELTKAYNRKWLFEKFLIDAKFTQNGSMAFIDIDEFKEINDTYGHVTGDKVLAMVTQLTKTIPQTRTIRYGGDEFILISSEEQATALTQKMQKLCTTLEKKRFRYQHHTFAVRLSYGIVTFKAGDTFEEVIETVDQMMYRHKSSKKPAQTVK